DEVIDIARDGALIADDRRRAKHDGIARLNLHQPMIAVGDTGQRRGWLALASSADNRQLVSWHMANVLRTNQHASGNAQIAQLYRHLHIVDHRATHQRHFASMLLRRIDDLLYS